MAITDETVRPGDLPSIVEKPEWVEHLPELKKGVRVQAGEDGQGPANFHARVFDSRTRYLKDLLDTLIDDETGLTFGGIFLQGHLRSEADLYAIDTKNLQIGTAWFLDHAMRVWNGKDWADSGSLKGDRGINILGDWPERLDLPPQDQRIIGDAYLWKHDIWVLIPPIWDGKGNINDFDDTPYWAALGIRGPDGKSVYEVWLEIPENQNKTKTQFLEEMRGDQGLDPFRAWLAMPGNKDRSYSEWLELVRGPEGPARAPFVVAGTKASTGLLPNPGDAQKAWYVGSDLYFWVDEDQRYSVIPAIVGKSAYEDWKLQEGNARKTIGEFLGALKGEKGDSIKGDPGKDGRNLHIMGTVPTSTLLSKLENVKDQDAYAALDTGNLWIYLPDEGGWKDFGPWRGVDGKSAYEVWRAAGNEDATLAQFWAFLRGQDGISMRVQGVVETVSDLPQNPGDQALYGVRSEHAMYMYIDDAWVNLGNFGIDGKDGIDGKSLKIIKILTPEDDTIPAPTEENKEKAYVNLEKEVFVNVTGNAWQSAGMFTGPQGLTGPQGQNFRPMGTIEKSADLKYVEKPQNGDAWVTSIDKMLYVMVDNQWQGPIDLIGPRGFQGEQGIPGALMPIKGVFGSLPELKSKRPTGELGDAYMLVDTTKELRNLAIWSPDQNDWIDTGPAGIKGEKGESIQGERGIQGIQGPVGSQWLILDTHDQPSDVFTGRPGDWAVNRDMNVFYKDSFGVWNYWGPLTAGDVNSPMESEGLVVRYANRWVPLPVDEVKNPQPGLFYARKLIGEDENGAQVLGWVVVEFAEMVKDLLNADDKQYVRVFKKGVGQKPQWAELDSTKLGLQDIDNPEDNTLYLRFAKNKTWVKYKVAPSDDKLYMSKNGDWVAFDRYDLKILKVAASVTIDPVTDGFVKLDNSSTTAKVVTIKNGPVDRGMVLVLTVVGIAGGISYGGSNIKWDQNTIPTLSGTRNIITFTWDGDIWTGAKGPGLLN